MTQITLHAGDNRESLRRLIDQGVRVQSVVSDPPYGLVSTTKRFGGDKAAPAKFGSDGAFARSSAGFMGSQWDGTGIERDPEFWRLIYDILLPGGYVLAFSSPRTGHWQACAMETAGFIMHPFFGWTYGSGFPKAHNASKAIDASLLRGSARTTDIRKMDMGDDYEPSGRGRVNFDHGGGSHMNGATSRREPATPEAQQWDGWAYGAQSMKPALEPIYVGQKPFSEKNGALNLLKHGVGAMNIDATRVPISQGDVRNSHAGSKVCTCSLRGASRSDYSADSGNQVSPSSEHAQPANHLPSARGCGPEHRALRDSRSDYPIESRSCGGPVPMEEGSVLDVLPSLGDEDMSRDRCATCGHSREDHSNSSKLNTTLNVESKGRHPANLLHDGSDDVVAMFPQSAGQQPAVRGTEPSRTGGENTHCYGEYGPRTEMLPRNDTGSAARFFNAFGYTEAEEIAKTLGCSLLAAEEMAGYLARHVGPDADPLFYNSKANKADRAGSKHPTVKPVALMQWLVRLVTPPGGIVLDPFAGSGTTAQAARREGFDCILMEAEPQFVADIRTRFNLPGDTDDFDALLSDDFDALLMDTKPEQPAYQP